MSWVELHERTWFNFQALQEEGRSERDYKEKLHQLWKHLHTEARRERFLVRLKDHLTGFKKSRLDDFLSWKDHITLTDKPEHVALRDWFRFTQCLRMRPLFVAFLAAQVNQALVAKRQPQADSDREREVFAEIMTYSLLGNFWDQRELSLFRRAHSAVFLQELGTSRVGFKNGQDFFINPSRLAGTAWRGWLIRRYGSRTAALALRAPTQLVLHNHRILRKFVANIDSKDGKEVRFGDTSGSHGPSSHPRKEEREKERTFVLSALECYLEKLVKLESQWCLGVRVVLGEALAQSKGQWPDSYSTDRIAIALSLLYGAPGKTSDWGVVLPSLLEPASSGAYSGPPITAEEKRDLDVMHTLLVHVLHGTSLPETSTLVEFAPAIMTHHTVFQKSLEKLIESCETLIETLDKCVVNPNNVLDNISSSNDPVSPAAPSLEQLDIDNTPAPVPPRLEQASFMITISEMQDLHRICFRNFFPEAGHPEFQTLNQFKSLTLTEDLFHQLSAEAYMVRIDAEYYHMATGGKDFKYKHFGRTCPKPGLLPALVENFNKGVFFSPHGVHVSEKDAKLRNLAIQLARLFIGVESSYSANNTTTHANLGQFLNHLAHVIQVELSITSTRRRLWDDKDSAAARQSHWESLALLSSLVTRLQTETKDLEPSFGGENSLSQELAAELNQALAALKRTKDEAWPLRLRVLRNGFFHIKLCTQTCREQTLFADSIVFQHTAAIFINQLLFPPSANVYISLENEDDSGKAPQAAEPNNKTPPEKGGGSGGAQGQVPARKRLVVNWTSVPSFVREILLHQRELIMNPTVASQVFQCFMFLARKALVETPVGGSDELSFYTFALSVAGSQALPALPPVQPLAATSEPTGVRSCPTSPTAASSTSGGGIRKGYFADHDADFQRLVQAAGHGAHGSAHGGGAHGGLTTSTSHGNIGLWRCTACNYDNTMTAHACTMCNLSRDGDTHEPHAGSTGSLRPRTPSKKGVSGFHVRGKKKSVVGSNMAAPEPVPLANVYFPGISIPALSPTHERFLDYVEKYVTSALYPVFYPQERSPAWVMDVMLQWKLESLSTWLRPGSVHIPSLEHIKSDAAVWEPAVSELNKLETFYSPREKLKCLVKCIHLLTKMLQVESGHYTAKPDSVHADMQLSALIYTICQAKPERLCSSIKYISQFIPANRMAESDGQFSYCLTQFFIAKTQVWRKINDWAEPVQPINPNATIALQSPISSAGELHSHPVHGSPSGGASSDDQNHNPLISPAYNQNTTTARRPARTEKVRIGETLFMLELIDGDNRKLDVLLEFCRNQNPPRHQLLLFYRQVQKYKSFVPRSKDQVYYGLQLYDKYIAPSARYHIEVSVPQRIFLKAVLDRLADLSRDKDWIVQPTSLPPPDVPANSGLMRTNARGRSTVAASGASAATSSSSSSSSSAAASSSNPSPFALSEKDHAALISPGTASFISPSSSTTKKSRTSIRKLFGWSKDSTMDAGEDRSQNNAIGEPVEEEADEEKVELACAKESECIFDPLVESTVKELHQLVSVLPTKATEL